MAQKSIAKYIVNNELVEISSQYTDGMPNQKKGMEYENSDQNSLIK